jgi:hypothetical protein
MNRISVIDKMKILADWMHATDLIGANVHESGQCLLHVLFLLGSDQRHVFQNPGSDVARLGFHLLQSQINAFCTTTMNKKNSQREFSPFLTS